MIKNFIVQIKHTNLSEIAVEKTAFLKLLKKNSRNGKNT